MKLNYQKKLDEQLAALTGKPKLLLHACCAPCSSYVLEYLSRYFDITLYFYNPNITPAEEYEKRLSELKRLAAEMPHENSVSVVGGKYDPNEFFAIARGLETAPECGERCKKCYRLRLFDAARYANENGFDYFTTTLSISPHKNAEWLNELGEEAEKLYGIKYLYSDFKKKNGYKRSIELSKIYSLYRQNYCGCIFSKQEREISENL